MFVHFAPTLFTVGCSSFQVQSTVPLAALSISVTPFGALFTQDIDGEPQNTLTRSWEVRVNI
jgi:hypothetical protein